VCSSDLRVNHMLRKGCGFVCESGNGFHREIASVRTIPDDFGKCWEELCQRPRVLSHRNATLASTRPDSVVNRRLVPNTRPVALMRRLSLQHAGNKFLIS